MSDDRKLIKCRGKAALAARRLTWGQRESIVVNALALTYIRRDTLGPDYWSTVLAVLSELAPSLAVQLRHLLQLGHIAELQERQQ